MRRVADRAATASIYVGAKFVDSVFRRFLLPRQASRGGYGQQQYHVNFHDDACPAETHSAGNHHDVEINGGSVTRVTTRWQYPQRSQPVRAIRSRLHRLRACIETCLVRFLRPIPCRRYDVFERTCCLPSKDLLGAGRIRNKSGRIAMAARHDPAPHAATTDLFDHLYDLVHGMTASGAEIEFQRMSALFEKLKRAHVGVGQVVHMDIVSNAGSVGRGIVSTEDLEFAAFRFGRGEREGNQMGFRIMKFADLAALIRARGIEIAQARKTKTVGAAVGFERVFEEKLGDTIWIYRLALRFLFDGHMRRHTVHRAG